MRVLVLGGSGFIGQRIVARLKADGDVDPVVASRAPQRFPVPAGVEQRHVDTLNAASLHAAMDGVDALVNCVAGDAAAIADGARLMVEAAANASRPPRIIHLSSMAVYGAAEGSLSEDAPHGTALGWYGQAKSEAESHVGRYAEAGRAVVVLRPGCVFGPGSEQWVGRIAALLQSGRLGDLGTAGDGWSNLVHVDDVAAAVSAGLRLQCGAAGPRVFNLSAPDSPRWNRYFTDLGQAVGATPVRRLSYRQVKLDAVLKAPLFKIAGALGRRIGMSGDSLVAVSPSLLRLWSQQLLLNSAAAIDALQLKMRAYPQGLNESAHWFNSRRQVRPT